MTEQEAEAFAARLTRIWAPDEVTIVFEESKLRYLGSYREPSLLEIKVRSGPVTNTNPLVFVLPQGTKEKWRPKMGCGLAKGNIKNLSHPQSTHERKLIHQFATQWLSFFRHGCWLSSCAIEASAHEKAEWIQGFSGEELEAWNLKM